MLKLQIKYDDAGSLVPWELHIYFITEEGEESDNYKVGTMCHKICSAQCLMVVANFKKIRNFSILLGMFKSFKSKMLSDLRWSL